MIHKYLLLLIGLIGLSPISNFAQHTSTNFKIVKRYVEYNSKREQLSLQYLKERHGIVKQKATIEPVMIVIHFTGSGTLNSNFNYFNRTEIENARQLNKSQSTLNVSAQFLVDRDGTVYQLMDDNQFARHTIGLNYCAIGVENIGSDKQPLTTAQLNANAQLVQYLAAKYPIKYLIGHQEYAVFKGSALWKETNSKYFTHKIDPGKDFMKKLREKVSNLGLKSQP